MMVPYLMKIFDVGGCRVVECFKDDCGCHKVWWTHYDCTVWLRFICLYTTKWCTPYGVCHKSKRLSVSGARINVIRRYIFMSPPFLFSLLFSECPLI